MTGTAMNLRGLRVSQSFSSTKTNELKFWEIELTGGQKGSDFWKLGSV